MSNNSKLTPKLRFPMFRKTAWAKRMMGDVLHETSRPIEMDDDTEYYWVTVKRRYGGVVSREVLKGSAIKVKSQFLVEKNDFLISKRQIVHNACGLVPGSLHGSIVSNEYSVLTPRENCSVEFFNYFAQQPAVSKSFLDSSVGIVIEKMLFKLDWWLKHEFLFPVPAEQQKIADCLSSLDELIAAEGRKWESLRAYKKGLMQLDFSTDADTLGDAYEYLIGQFAAGSGGACRRKTIPSAFSSARRKWTRSPRWLTISSSAPAAFCGIANGVCTKSEYADQTVFSCASVGHLALFKTARLPHREFCQGRRKRGHIYFHERRHRNATP